MLRLLHLLLRLRRHRRLRRIQAIRVCSLKLDSRRLALVKLGFHRLGFPKEASVKLGSLNVRRRSVHLKWRNLNSLQRGQEGMF